MNNNSKILFVKHVQVEIVYLCLKYLMSGFRSKFCYGDACKSDVT